MNLTPEEKQQLLYELMLVALNSKVCSDADSPKIDLYHVMDAVMRDSQYRCTTRQTMIMALRRSPVWERIKPFLKYGDSACARKGCQCGDYEHKNRTGKCSGHHYSDGKWSGTKIPCTCPEYIPKDFK